MDLSDWKDQVQQRIAGTAHVLRLMAPGTLYGFMASSTLMPLANAANPDQALAILTGILGSVGAGLVADEIKGWLDRSEAELARELQETLADDGDLRRAVDAVMHQAGTAQALQDALTDADKKWFVGTLRQEMETLGNGDHYEAIVSCSGAIAFKGGVAAGEGGVAVGRDNYGPITINNALPDPEQFRAAEDQTSSPRPNNSRTYSPRKRRPTPAAPSSPCPAAEPWRSIAARPLEPGVSPSAGASREMCPQARGRTSRVSRNQR